MVENYSSFITVTPSIRSGKPIVRGTRITIDDVLSYLAAGMKHEEIIEDFPPLTETAILACLACAAEHGSSVQE